MFKKLVFAAALAAGISSVSMVAPAQAASASGVNVAADGGSGAGVGVAGREPVEMRRGGRGHHYGWSRGKHRGWYKGNRGRGRWG